MTDHPNTNDSAAGHLFWCDDCGEYHDDRDSAPEGDVYAMTFAQFAKLSLQGRPLIAADALIVPTISAVTKEAIAATATRIAGYIGEEAQAIAAGDPARAQLWLNSMLPRRSDYSPGFAAKFADAVKVAAALLADFPCGGPNSVAEELAAYGIVRVCFLHNSEELDKFELMLATDPPGSETPDGLIEAATIALDLEGLLGIAFAEYDSHSEWPRVVLDADDAAWAVGELEPERWLDSFPDSRADGGVRA